MQTIANIIEAEEVKRMNILLQKPHVFEQMILHSTRHDAMIVMTTIFSWNLHKVKFIVDSVKENKLSFENAIVSYENK